MSKKAVIFDAFGTLLKIHEGRHPYRQLLKAGKQAGRRPRPDDIQKIMTYPLSLPDMAKELGIVISPSSIDLIVSELESEVDAIQAYEDGIDAVRLLQDNGIGVAICSNLGFPYVSAVKRLFPDVAHAMSCEIGAMKPDQKIYQASCLMLGNPANVYMIGDSMTCDKVGPNDFGIAGNFLDRSGRHGDYQDLLTFAKHVIGS